MSVTTHIPLSSILEQLVNPRKQGAAAAETSTESKNFLRFVLTPSGDNTATEFNFVFRTHDGSLSVTQERYTLEVFEKVARDLSLLEYEPVEFTGE